ncbi:MAG: DUF3794 domain-containing protein [Clostridia bacterium]|nr:DUF3794 domain-containing protein [Clostridia bacterium]
MENNIIKTSIWTNETILNEKSEQPVDVDFSLPDYCPDVRRVLKCKAVPRITMKTLSGNTLTVNGSVAITVFYADEEGKIRSFLYSYPFEKMKDLETDVSNDRITVTAKCEYMNCRAVTSRKLDIHGAVCICITAKRKKSCEIISDIDDKNIEVLRGTSPATTPTDFGEKSLIIEEDGELPSGDISDMLLRYEADVCIKECKAISGKVIAKGEMKLFLRYLCGDMIKSMKTTIPFSQVIEVKTTGENCECSAKAQICFLDIKPKTDNDGNFNIYSVNAKLIICAETYCKNDVAVILDAYSKKYNAEIIKEPVSFEQLIVNIGDSLSVKKVVELEDISISSVKDCWYDTKINDIKVMGENLCLSGALTVCVIAEVKGENTSYYEKTVDFEYCCPIEFANSELRFEPSLSVNSFGYTITGDNSIEIRAEVAVYIPVFKKIMLDAVTNITVNDEVIKKETDDIAMIVYFGNQGEKIWDIGQKYYAGCEEIKEINGITDDELKTDTMLLIPVI